ncbi:MAG TPA: hypothetical protein VIK49_01805 [Steroidobacteraceae bacterium]
MMTQPSRLARWHRQAAAILSLLALPLAEASESPPSQFTAAVAQLRQAVGLWDVTTTQYGEDGAVAGVMAGTYRFDWIVPDRVLAGRSDVPELKQSSGILFYVNERHSTIEMASVGADGHLWVMTGPAGGEIRTTPPTPLADGRSMQLRFTRFAVAPDRFESRMEVSLDGGESWKPGNHQLFVRAADHRGSSGGGLRYRKRLQQYIPLT